jgi:hypothetical protein
MQGITKMQNSPRPQKDALKERQLEKIFEGIEDEIAILTANVKFNHTTCKINVNNLKLTLAYIEDTNKLVQVLKNRLHLLTETTA